MLEGGQQLPGAPIPEPRGFVRARRQDPRPVGAEHRGINRALMLKGGQQLPGAPRPRAARCCPRSPSRIRVPSELNTAELTSLSCWKVASSFPEPPIPEPRGSLRARCQDPRPVGTEDRGPDFALMPEGGQQLPGAPIPEPRGFVPIRRQDPGSVGTEHRGTDRAFMLEGGQQLPRVPIPEPRGVVPARRQDPRPVGTEDRGTDKALMLEGGEQLPGAPIPEPRGSIRACRQDPRPVGAEHRRTGLRPHAGTWPAASRNPHPRAARCCPRSPLGSAPRQG